MRVKGQFDIMYSKSPCLDPCFMLEMLSSSREVILPDKRRSRINLQQGKFRLNIMKNVVTVRSLKQSSRLSGETVKAGSDTFLSVLVGRIINKHFSVKGEWHPAPPEASAKPKEPTDLTDMLGANAYVQIKWSFLKGLLQPLLSLCYMF